MEWLFVWIFMLSPEEILVTNRAIVESEAVCMKLVEYASSVNMDEAETYVAACSPVQDKP